MHCLDVAHAVIRRAVGTPEDTHRFRQALAPLNTQLSRLFVNRSLFQAVGGTYGHWRAERAILRLQRHWRLRCKCKRNSKNTTAASLRAPAAAGRSHPTQNQPQSLVAPRSAISSTIELQMSPKRASSFFQNAQAFLSNNIQRANINSPQIQRDSQAVRSLTLVSMQPGNLNDQNSISLPILSVMQHDNMQYPVSPLPSNVLINEREDYV